MLYIQRHETDLSKKKKKPKQKRASPCVSFGSLCVMITVFHTMGVKRT